MLDEMVIKHCAPTLAGLKTANMFTCHCQSVDQLKQEVRQLNRRLCQKGLRAIPLKKFGNKAIVYLFRPDKLEQDLSDHEARQLLQQEGYLPERTGCCLAQLVQRLEKEKDFPHEIGLFLGYPPEDVKGFIENRATCCKCSGCWKVYGDQEKAMKTFARFRKCTDVYGRQWAKGRSIEQLTVAV